MNNVFDKNQELKNEQGLKEKKQIKTFLSVNQVFINIEKHPKTTCPNNFKTARF